MRRLPLIGALVTAITGLFTRAPKKPSAIDLGPLDKAPETRPDFRRRRGGGGHGWTRRLYRKFAKNALERYGLDVIGPDGRVDPETRRLMRNARKLERQTP